MQVMCNLLSIFDAGVTSLNPSPSSIFDGTKEEEDLLKRPYCSGLVYIVDAS